MSWTGRKKELVAGVVIAGALAFWACGSEERPVFSEAGDAGGTDSAPPGPFGDAGLPEAGPSEHCEERAEAGSFAPVEQWTWTAPAPIAQSSMAGSAITPLVGNFTDDNNDGRIDLSDIPDVIVVAIEMYNGTVGRGIVHVLSGDTGAEKVTFQGAVDPTVTPAFGDIDHDGKPELVTIDTTGHLVAYANDGTIRWVGDPSGYKATISAGFCTTVALYDLDGDGKTEILAGWEVFDATGHELFGDPTNAAEFNGQFWCVTPIAADLDGDGKLEVLMGHETFRADGSLYWKIPSFLPAHPHVANVDGDPEPEIVLTNADGITLVEHDGKIKFGPVRPTGEAPASQCWGKPAVLHDFDGDGVTDVAAGTCEKYVVYRIGPTGLSIRWSRDVQDLSGLATATAFDFLGDGTAEAIYADETKVYAFDGKTGETSLSAPRTSGTLIEYPVVADIDNDRSAEIVYVSNYLRGQTPGPTVTVLKDVSERWIPARRIWNQHAYHVTNIEENGAIPAKMKSSWKELNTFRTNSQIRRSGEDCAPAKPVN